MGDSLIPRVPSLAGMLGCGGMNVPATATAPNDAEEFIRMMKAPGVKTITGDALDEEPHE